MPLQAQGKRRAAPHDASVKRFRVSRACDQCRSERSKCDGNQKCAPCTESARECTFTSNPKKRGLPPGYIRTIELALALVFQQDASIESSMIGRLGQEDTTLLARDTKESHRLHKNWRKSRFCRELNRTLTGGQASVGDDGALSSDEDSDAAAEPEAMTSYVMPEGPGLISSQQYQEVQSTQRPPTMQPYTLSSNLTPLPPNCWRMLESYTTYTQCWLPISEKLDILKLSYSYPDEGLKLSPDMPDAGYHAEMWSIFALGSYHDATSDEPQRNHPESINSRKLYAVTQSLIPTELGSFQLGHVKALLNLALVNLQSLSYNAAWILVGAASRILSTVQSMPGEYSSRFAHVMAGCYLLDNFLALAMHRRPYLNISDVERAGRIEEDGLEEWQPWPGNLKIPTEHRSRSPTLALSSFNRLVDLMDVFSRTALQSSARDDLLRDFAMWKTKLPPKFDFVRSESTSAPLTPPALLLQLTHLVTLLALSPSQAWLERTLALLDTCQKQLGTSKLPSVFICLLESIKNSSRGLPLDEVTRNRIDGATTTFATAPDPGHGGTLATGRDGTYTVERQSHHRRSQVPATSVAPSFCESVVAGAQQQRQQPTLQQSQSQQSQPQQSHSQQSHQQQLNQSTSLIDDLLPDMNPSQQPQSAHTVEFSPNAIDADFTSPALDAYDPSIPGDLESFFDELASLHGAKRLQNQPQFMQNLGFAPEVSMADLLATQSGQHIHMDPSTYGAEHEGEPMQFPLSDYYNAG
ncbi:hypothetical protein BDU57DRAFT_519153 [Ampelomyces quisqualis]|uniref:Zn(2)-C6 fungal-type domain-containing protein n=1 Tax=Ampelomyces quisqualis TaxID=50730 RepID=A0A6A5QF36_AMPQU|nr:hypothetical protein BDU57DRAFT_519153 [Ampelomyces quisqualis]